MGVSKENYQKSLKYQTENAMWLPSGEGWKQTMNMYMAATVKPVMVKEPGSFFTKIKDMFCNLLRR